MEVSPELIATVLALVTSLLMTGLRRVATSVEGLPPVVRTMIVVVLAAAVSWLGGVLGLDLPANPLTWDGTTINTVMTALLAMGLHAAGKALPTGKG